MSTAWSHLPNAMHIDRVLASVKAHPKNWYAAWDAAWSAAGNAARRAAGNAARDAALDAVYAAVYAAALDAALSAARDVARYVARHAAWGAMAALIAWDDCSQYLDMPSDQLKMWYHLTERPACLLLLPAVIAFEKINELETA